MPTLNITLDGSEFDPKFKAMDDKFDALDARFDALDAKFAAVGARIDALLIKPSTANALPVPPPSPTPPVDPVSPAPVPTPTPDPAPPAVPATPIAPTVLKPVMLEVGPTRKFQRITDAMVSIADQTYADGTSGSGQPTLDVTMNIDPVPSDPNHYKDQFSSHFIAERDGLNYWPHWDGPMFERMTVQATPGMGIVDLPGTPDCIYYGKGFFITGQFGSTFKRIRFSGAHRADGYGNLSAIRFEPCVGAVIELEDVEVFGCDNGLMGGGPGMKLILRRVYLHDCGSGTGLTHNFYGGGFDEVYAEDVLSVNANVGHLFKSRALKTTLRRVRLIDGPTGSASYCLDVPNGGEVDIDGLFTHKGPNASNAFAIAVGEEGTNASFDNLPHVGLIKIRNWTAVSEVPDGKPFGKPVALWNAANAPLDISGTKLFGIEGMMVGMYGATSIVTLPGNPEAMTALPKIDLSSPVLSGVSTETLAG